MRRLRNLNVSKSLAQEKLVFDENWADVLNRGVVFFYFSIITLAPIVGVHYSDLSNSNDAFAVYFICPLISCFGAYVIFRKASEKSLTSVVTPLSQEGNKALLMQYALQRGLEIYRSNASLLIVNQPVGLSTGQYKETTVFIVSDKQVRFAMLRDNSRMDLPVLISHLLLKRELKKFC